MTHDPLCPSLLPYNTLEGYPCQCRLIAQVRQDMLRRCEAAAYADLLSLEDDMREAFGKGDAARIVAGYRSAMPGFRQFNEGEA